MLKTSYTTVKNFLYFDKKIFAMIFFSHFQDQIKETVLYGIKMIPARKK